MTTRFALPVCHKTPAGFVRLRWHRCAAPDSAWPGRNHVWVASHPVEGHISRGFEAVRESFAENFVRRGELGGACCVYHRGEKVVDLWVFAIDEPVDRGVVADLDRLAVVLARQKPAGSACSPDSRFGSCSKR